MSDKISIVSSYTDTVPGKMIRMRAALKFWNRYPGDQYSHISLSRDNILNNMMSFARKEVNHPLNSGLVKEDIRKGMFALKKDESQIAVMELKVTRNQFNKVNEIMEKYWDRREELGFNFAGLASMLFCGRGVESENNFFCSQWVTTVLQESGIDLFDGQKPCNIRPFDFYSILKENIVYEGPVVEYPQYNIIENIEIPNVKRKKII